ncbi:hypothetical protein T492DRAFT_308570 [Pavlovales sp. CCMP2436]|nr:hypothetical protein T492DRAFT_308570 [Pavlovales sp. CCMP2436]|mmetsp:Transcript_40584/g.100275  ORF Transcript_40584/g.100275 Transcript_40584/m.100275 type:complete len:250 (-) Transcript_40584:173-922(-)
MWQAAEAVLVASAARGMPITATSLKRVTFVSDGTCYSTCAVIVANAYMRGLASVVTNGGVPGQPVGEMDISSGRACNVYDWNEGMYDPLTRIQFLSAYVIFLASGLPAVPLLPFPMSQSEGSSVCFAQREWYQAIPLGFDSLPSEFLRFPPSANMVFWPTGHIGNLMAIDSPPDQAKHDLMAILHFAYDAAPAPFKLHCNAGAVLVGSDARGAANYTGLLVFASILVLVLVIMLLVAFRRTVRKGTALV